MKKLYVYYSKDKYRLPIAVADSAKELGEMIGKTENTIWSAISHGKNTFGTVEITDREYQEIRGGKHDKRRGNKNF